MSSSLCDVLELGLIFPPFCSIEKFVFCSYWTHNFSFPTCVRMHWSSSYRISLTEQSSYLSGYFYSYLTGVTACLVLWKYESLSVCYTDRPKGFLKLLSHCIMLTLPTSHAAGLLQVAWKSFNLGLAFLQGCGHWPHLEPGHRSGCVGAPICAKCLIGMSGLHQSLNLWSERSFLVHSGCKLLWQCVFEFFLVCITWCGEQALLLSFAVPLFHHQELDIDRASAVSCCHLQDESYSFWSLLVGVKFMRGFWEVIFLPVVNWSISEKCLRTW